jgi:hypothetical protein
MNGRKFLCTSGVDSLLYSGDVWSYFEATTKQKKNYVVGKLVIIYFHWLNIFHHYIEDLKITLVINQNTMSFIVNKKTPWSESASELYRSSDCSLSAKWSPTFADRGCHVVSVTSLRPYSRFPRQEPLLFYQVAPQLYSRGWMDPVPDPLLFFFFW